MNQNNVHEGPSQAYGRPAGHAGRADSTRAAGCVGSQLVYRSFRSLTAGKFCSVTASLAAAKPQECQPSTEIVVADTSAAAMTWRAWNTGLTRTRIGHFWLSEGLGWVSLVQRIIELKNDAPSLIVVFDHL